jgi:5-formyltetrahydrofolate cyclo-ligase
MSNVGYRSSMDREKAALRDHVKVVRDAMPIERRLEWSDVIAEKIIRRSDFTSATCVLAYNSFGSELETESLLTSVLTTKRLVFPRINRNTRKLDLYEICDLRTQLTAGPWGIREPRVDVCRKVHLDEVDFIVVPGLAFSARGDRLGYGGGYYDRLLANCRPQTKRVAGAFSIQVFDSIPVDDHDIAVDEVVTESSTHARYTNAKWQVSS